jgi:hypothetical protein
MITAVRVDRVEEDENGSGGNDGVDDAVGVVAHGDPPVPRTKIVDRHGDGEGGGDVAEFAVAGEDVDLDLDAGR